MDTTGRHQPLKFLSSHPRVSDDGRDRAVDGGRQEVQPLRPSGRDYDPIGYRHGLRASELCDLQWSQVELATGRLHVRRAKNGSPSVHPMQGDEIRALRRLQREQELSSHVFMTERDRPMTPKAFHALFGRIGARAKMPFPIHPHMLRHGCGYALANAGHDTRALQAYLGHKNIQRTVRYSELAPDRFKNFWR
jgi:type 1 fimbriae regulatory protein FimB/type 1 fimbriae regulatory protein FimE